MFAVIHRNMNLTLTHAQIKVQDFNGSAQVNIHSIINGYAADIHITCPAAYIAQRQGEPGLRLIIAPGEQWKNDIEAEGFKIIGKIYELVRNYQNRE